MLVSCSIVLYKNDVNILLGAINSFLNTKLNVSLYLIDNSPTNDLEKYFKELKVTYISNISNPGFGASHNIAIKLAMEQHSDFHLVLNPDIYFNTGVLENIVDFMVNNKEFGLLMPKVLYPDGSMQYLCKRNPTFFDLFVRGFMPSFLRRLFKNRIEKYDYRDFDLNSRIYDIPYLSGCFMFFRTSVFEKINLFDENIFMYLEDADITRRVLEHSRTIYFPDTFVYHLYSGLTHKKLKYKIITIQSAFTYFNKWGWLNNII